MDILADRLMAGQDDSRKYIYGVCYDAVAYVRYLLNPNITPTMIADIRGNNWLAHFDFLNSPIWTGSLIPKGTAIGFERKIDGNIFHAALVADDNNHIRGVNALINSSWLIPYNLAHFTPGPHGWFNYDNTDVRIRLSLL
jgi:hypothetical protein